MRPKASSELYTYSLAIKICIVVITDFINIKGYLLLMMYDYSVMVGPIFSNGVNSVVALCYTNLTKNVDVSFLSTEATRTAIILVRLVKDNATIESTPLCG